MVSLLVDCIKGFFHTCREERHRTFLYHGLLEHEPMERVPAAKNTTRGFFPMMQILSRQVQHLF